MKVRILYDQGTASIVEDGIIFQPPCYFGAIDGISGVYLPQENAETFNGMTGGQLASQVISRVFNNASLDMSLRDIFKKANNMLCEINKVNGLSLQSPEFLPSAAFAAAKVDSSAVSILQAGDSLAIWQEQDGTLGGTPNKAYIYEAELLRTIAALMLKHEGDRQKMWEEFRPILIGKRRAGINTTQGGFALLNGQPQFENFWQEFIIPREKMAFLLLFSDGFVPFEWTQQELGLAGKIIRLYQKGGLYRILEAVHLIADEKKSSSHEDYPEATAVAIEF